MKQHHLSTKFLRFYILIGILGFFLITLGGSYMVEKHLEHSLSAALYTEAHNIASNEAVKSNISSSTVDTLQEHLCAISDFQDAVLWIINSNGEIIVSTQKNIDVRDPIPLEEFDASKWGSNYYQIGKFYGFFKTDHLSVIAPITSDMETKGYVAIHYSMTNLYQSRSSILFIMQVIFLLCYAATSLLLWAYSHYIRKPLARIMKGASEYAGGNLAYKIDVTSDDEMGYLAKTLNYMSDELNKNGEYQRKFIANVSHDFRTPLTLVADPVEQLLEDKALTPRQQSLLKVVHKNVHILLRLVNQILDFRKYENDKLELVRANMNLRVQLQEWSHSFQTLALKKHIHFVLEVNDDRADYLMAVDAEKMERVYFNLLSNAFKFTPENGTITVTLSTLTKEEGGRYARLVVADTGSGISVQHIRHIFDRFYQIDVNHAGSGIGLALAKAFVELHGGEITADSVEGKGTVFTVDIPMTVVEEPSADLVQEPRITQQTVVEELDETERGSGGFGSTGR